MRVQHVLTGTMVYFQNGDEVEIRDVEDFDPVKIFECGQCFRWSPDGNGSYVGIAFGRAARVRAENGAIFISGTVEEFEEVWRAYFDLNRDYAAIRAALAADTYMDRAVRHGAGLRILRQDTWEALVSFILSQCNNIPRIRSIVEKFCALYGEPVAFEGQTVFAFPSAEKTAALTEADLAPIRCGFRAPSILEAARAVADGKVDLEALRYTSPEKALTELKKLSRVGDKVARCVMLYGLQMLDTFPVDTWIGKALRDHYPDGFDAAAFSPHTGIAQQYMFYETRCAGMSARRTGRKPS